MIPYRGKIAIFLLSLIVALLFSQNGNGIMANSEADNQYLRKRLEMVENQLRARGIKDKSVLESMATVPRHFFVPISLIEQAYDDTPLPIGYNQTISQPYIVALMTEAAELKNTDIVLEIGTGCGYSAAVLSHLAKQVYSSEIIPKLARVSQINLKKLNYNNVIVITGDGSAGFPEHGPFNAILVTAMAPAIPQALKEQLALKGRLIIPVKNGHSEELKKITRLDMRTYEEENLGAVRFVPLKGNHGWV